MKKPKMLLSLPGQGSDFFIGCIVDANINLKYTREFFNPACASIEHKNQIEQAFGCEYNPDKIFVNKHNTLEYIFQNTWNKTDLNIAKEVFGFAKVSFYKKHFDLFCLYRNRSCTFPTSRAEYLISIFDFLISNESNNEIKLYLKNFKDPIEKQALTHVLCWAIQFQEAQDVQVINYSQLMNLEKEELNKYLDEKLPKELYNPIVCDNIIQRRQKEIEVKRRQEYEKLNIEQTCLDFIKFLQKLDIAIKDEYWAILIEN
jgi:hypothetical protein